MATRRAISTPLTLFAARSTIRILLAWACISVRFASRSSSFRRWDFVVFSGTVAGMTAMLHPVELYCIYFTNETIGGLMARRQRQLLGWSSGRRDGIELLVVAR